MRRMYLQFSEINGGAVRIAVAFEAGGKFRLKITAYSLSYRSNARGHFAQDSSIYPPKR